MDQSRTTIRAEAPKDWAAIRDIHTLALGSEEARLVELLRERQGVLGLVAAIDDRPVGHIMFSPMSLAEAPGDFRAMGLAPMSVLPEFQRQGIGSELVRAGLEWCKQQGFDAAFVLGHPSYYPRFGFTQAKAYGLDNEYGADEAFMVMELKPGVLYNIAGLVKYAPEFKNVGC